MPGAHSSSDGLSNSGDAGAALPPLAVACFRCGVCCERWQPLLSPAEQERLSDFLALTPAELRDQFTSPYPFDDEARLLNQRDGHCVFLAYDDEQGYRRARCTVHPARPAACRDWQAGLDQRECVTGLDRFATPEGAIALSVLYPDPVEREQARPAVESVLGKMLGGEG